ncbi:hypothetical protein BB560_006209 [Smittium megazygosporum]|uniref:HSF-type DNA-binding domain-containing protein n=1 Tax=Smittium megazygosporum TaxID=133381 RepID=A0A2T9YD86_9FUNG|nr:hypothetical protein BB560_006887 [Smittium megazygosporum]PVU90308.1 hypothetical protein BB560_006209 [Smittium megazygosporum]
MDDVSKIKSLFSNTIQKTDQYHNEIDMLGLAISVPEFVKKLFRILEDESYSKIIFWSKSGESFIVKDQNELSKSVLPKHFKHNNFASFVRQLNKYDFHKVKNSDEAKYYGESVWEFKHPNFKHGRHELLEKIKRKPALKSRMSMASVKNSPYPIRANQRLGLNRHISGMSNTNDLQNQIVTLTHANSQMTKYLNQMTTCFQTVNEELAMIKKNMITQDQLMSEFLKYVLAQEQKTFSN